MAREGPILRLLCSLASGALVCDAQPSRTALVETADYYADLYRVPRELVRSIIEIESNWQPYAVSEKGAAGLMQLMPQMAATLGVTNRFDVDQNIRGGVAYLARLLSLFEGDVRLAAAAYYAGEGRIRRSGLAYSNADVFRYVATLTRSYQDKRTRAGSTIKHPPRGETEP